MIGGATSGTAGKVLYTDSIVGGIEALFTNALIGYELAFIGLLVGGTGLASEGFGVKNLGGGTFWIWINRWMNRGEGN